MPQSIYQIYQLTCIYLSSYTHTMLMWNTFTTAIVNFDVTSSTFFSMLAVTKMNL